MDTYNYNISNYIFVAMINNDYSGIVDKEIEQIAEFEDSLPEGGIMVLPEEEADNYTTCDVTGWSGRCYDIQVVVLGSYNAITRTG